MEHKFKVGDKCKVIYVEQGDNFEIGDIIEIDGIDEVDEELPYRDAKFDWFEEDQLELVCAEDPVPTGLETVSMEVPVSLKDEVEKIILDRSKMDKVRLINRLVSIFKGATEDQKGMEELREEFDRMVSHYTEFLDDNGEL